MYSDSRLGVPLYRIGIESVPRVKVVESTGHKWVNGKDLRVLQAEANTLNRLCGCAV